MKRLRIIAATVLIAAVVALALRIVLVEIGVLYGTVAVSRVDGIVSGAFGVGLAAAAAGLARRKPPNRKARSVGRKTTPEEKAPAFVDRIATLTAICSVIAVLVSALNLFFPIDRLGLSKPTCSGAHTLHTRYVGITTGPEGNNSRSGPGRAFPANGRFSKDCSLGFSAYCIGDPIVDMAGTTDKQQWLTSRWLLLAKQPAGWRAHLASFLSGETPEPQFVADANIAPATSYEGLPLAAPSRCPSSYRYPGQAKLQAYDPAAKTLSATADHAVNMGFATWTPPGQGFRNENSYQPVYNPAFLAADNPGAASVAGQKSVAWAYRGSLLDNLDPKRTGGAHAPARVVVMAIPCISDNLPATPDKAATATYEIAAGPAPQLQPQSVTGYDPLQLARAACQANA